MTAKRKMKTGVVVSDKMEKTRVVEVSRKVKHTQYGKVIKKRSKFYAHDEKNQSHKGDVVRIVETRPLSRMKRWRVDSIIKVDYFKGVSQREIEESATGVDT